MTTKHKDVLLFLENIIMNNDELISALRELSILFGELGLALIGEEETND